MSQEGRHYKYEKYEFWADRGMITLVDTELAADSSRSTHEHTWRIPPGEFMKRAMSALIAEPDKYPSKLAKLRRLLQDAKEACLLAKRYGDPTDPSVLEHVIRHQRKRSIVLPGELPPMPGTRLKISPNAAGADILAKGVNVVPDLVIEQAATLTKKRVQAEKRMVHGGRS